MIPLHDNIPSRTTPWVNYAMIALCTLAFLAQLQSPDGGGVLVERYGMIPARITNPGEPVPVVETVPVETMFGVTLREVRRPAEPAGVPSWLTVLTCIFLHGGWLHFLGNMWFLYIFGDNVEDRLGHLRYLGFYVVTGMAASITHLVTEPSSTVPTIGASGAIAGVMGAYVFLYPRARVVTLIPIFILLHIMVVPAVVFLGVWFVIQLFQGVAAIGSVQSGGVAWWAHIGGFVVGLALAVLAERRGWNRPRVEIIRPGTDRTGWRRARSRRYRL